MQDGRDQINRKGRRWELKHLLQAGLQANTFVVHTVADYIAMPRSRGLSPSPLDAVLPLPPVPGAGENFQITSLPQSRQIKKNGRRQNERRQVWHLTGSERSNRSHFQAKISALNYLNATNPNFQAKISASHHRSLQPKSSASHQRTINPKSQLCVAVDDRLGWPVTG